jgi:predicted ribonuclease YlaK
VEIDAVSESSADADQEILDTCESLTFFTGKRVVVVTGDYGMQVRAAAREIEAIPMPEEHRQQLD